jgi:hypothetical protein
MKVIGIDIDKKRAIFIALEKDANGNISNITEKSKFLEIKDDQNNDEIASFKKNIHSIFNEIIPSRIAIITRQTKGRFSASPYSFKLEALIQCYSKIPVEFVSPQALNAFYKKNEFELPFENKYQENALKLANFLLAE